MPYPLFTLTSSLHDAKSLDTSDKIFFSELEQAGLEFDVLGDDYGQLEKNSRPILYVRTGGTESIFKKLFPMLHGDVLLLTSGRNNSLAASMEILSFLNQNGRKGEILHGDASYIAERVRLALGKVLQGQRIGVVGKPSDWLIASAPNTDRLRDCLGLELAEVDIVKLIDKVAKLRAEGRHYPMLHENVPERLVPVYKDAMLVYAALKELVYEYKLSALTIRCFDLLGTIGNTACLALAMLNSEGVPASCEGDIPALVTMMLSQQLFHRTGFQANPASIRSDEMLFAHCTVPFNMVKSYQFDTHFESGIGIAIAGNLLEGDVTLFKVAGDLRRFFVAEGSLLRNQHEPNLCRTQVLLKLDDPSAVDYFLHSPIGNHHIILNGHHKKEIEALMSVVI